VGLYEFLQSNKETLKSSVLRKSPALWESISLFLEYMEDYPKKLALLKELIGCFRSSSDSSTHIRKIRGLNAKLLRMASLLAPLRASLESARGEGQSFMDGLDLPATVEKGFAEAVDTLFEVSRFLGPFVSGQNRSTTFIDDGIGMNAWVVPLTECIAEEASVLFCSLVKDAFEEKACAEKKLILSWYHEVEPELRRVRTIHEPCRPFQDVIDEVLASASAVEFFTKLVIGLKEHTLARCIQVLVQNPRTKQLEVKLYSYLPHLPMYDIAHEGGIIAQSVSERQSVVVGNVLACSRYDMYDATVLSECVVPIFAGNETYGALNVEDSLFDCFDSGLVESLERLFAAASPKLNGFRDGWDLEKTDVVTPGMPVQR